MTTNPEIRATVNDRSLDAWPVPDRRGRPSSPALRSRILELLGAMPGIQEADIACELGEQDRSEIRHAIDDLQRRDKLTRSGDGQGWELVTPDAD